MSLNLLFRPLFPLPSNLPPALAPLLELLSGLLMLEEPPDDSGFDGPLDDEARELDAFSDPETGDVDGADEDEASPVTETFLLNLSMTADKDPFVRLGAALDVDATPIEEILA